MSHSQPRVPPDGVVSGSVSRFSHALGHVHRVGNAAEAAAIGRVPNHLQVAEGLHLSHNAAVGACIIVWQQ
jgi:hypothetical protein